MRIAVSGAGRLGKTTFINDFIKQWPEYKTPESLQRLALLQRIGKQDCSLHCYNVAKRSQYLLCF